MKSFNSAGHTLIWSLVLSWYRPLVRGNTEIVNFSVEPPRDPVSVALPESISQWPLLRFESNERQFDVHPARIGTPMASVCETVTRTPRTTWNGPFDCPHELWLVLDLDASAWKGYNSFTLRLSWPASFPADFELQIYGAEALQRVFENHTGNTYKTNIKTQPVPPRTRYARVRVVDSGVLTPKSPPSSSPPGQTAVPFTLILEPLYFGVLPASVTPTLFFMLPVIASVMLLVPSILAHLEGIAQDARQENQKRKAD